MIVRLRRHVKVSSRTNKRMNKTAANVSLRPADGCTRCQRERFDGASVEVDHSELPRERLQVARMRMVRQYPHQCEATRTPFSTLKIDCTSLQRCIEN